ncbi:MAG: hypothetical protein B6D61_05775 [Bacteroidetes bacterium 4484_249]|nr:MAG: hypothetical protein B6D61_05775 [Bacteroidetes bacterium 4484_249]
MSSYTISNTKLNPNRVFILQKSELEKRLDPAFYYELRNNKFEFAYPSKTISRIVKSYSGGTPNKSISDFWNGDICWASPKDMKDFYLEDTKDKITFEGIKNSSASIAPKGSVLIVFRSGILKHTLPVSITKVETSINQDLKVLVPTDDVLPEYLAVFLKTFEKRILPRIVKHSTTVQSINQDEFNQLAIPIPEIEIQKKVIDIYKSSIEQKKQNEAEADKLLSSIDDYLLGELGINLPEPPENTLKNRMFTVSLKDISGSRFDPFIYQKYFQGLFNAIKNCKYETIPLKMAIAKLSKGIEVGSKEYVSDGFSFVRVADIDDFNIRVNNTDKKINADTFYKLKNFYKPNVGEILYTKDGTIGFCVVVEKDEDYIISSGILRIDTNYNFNNYFLKYLLSSNLFKQLSERISIGTVIKHLTLNDWLNIQIPSPPLDKQIEIAKHISGIREQVEKLKDKTAEALKKASKEIEKLLIGDQ